MNCAIYRKGKVKSPCEMQCESCLVWFGADVLLPFTARTWPM